MLKTDLLLVGFCVGFALGASVWTHLTIISICLLIEVVPVSIVLSVAETWIPVVPALIKFSWKPWGVVQNNEDVFE